MQLQTSHFIDLLKLGKLGVSMDSLDPTYPSNLIGPDNVLKQEYTNCHIRYSLKIKSSKLKTISNVGSNLRG